jgi:methionyl-tRNA formyltransferase
VLGELLKSEHEVCTVVTTPDQPAGRKMRLTPTVICAEAEKLGVPVLKPEKLVNNREFIVELCEKKPDALLVASYGKILSKRTLKTVEWPLNVHPSLLPDLRGASPVRSALLRGDSVTGCSVMQMTPRLDDGDLLLQQQLAIAPEWNYHDLEEQLALLGGKQAVVCLNQIAAGTVELTPQDDELATYTKLFTRDDTIIDWRKPASELHSFVRAWDPDVGALARLPDGRRLKIWDAAVVETDSAQAEPGAVLDVTRSAVLVATGRGTLAVTEVQPESKKRMPVASFLAGNQLNPGDTLG